ncbi:MAG: IclR family transcriptional regulator [Actinomycetota bacterium]|nr:IclR family transcriptional regulator [Actinomycetota bacterium]
MSGAGDSGPEDRTRDGDFVRSLERGLIVLRSFGPERPRQTLSEVAQETGLTRAAARRFLLTLERLGYLAYDGRHFSLRSRVLELGYAYLSSLPLWDLAVPHMRRLVEEVHESCSASVLDGDEIVYVARVPTKRIMTINLGIGSRLPAYATSMGRVLLAGLPPAELDAHLAAMAPERLTHRTVVDADDLRAAIDEVREAGWAIVDQELEEGVRSVAAPLIDADGRVVAAINVSAHAARVPLETLRDDVAPKLVETAKEINDELRRRR